MQVFWDNKATDFGTVQAPVNVVGAVAVAVSSAVSVGRAVKVAVKAARSAKSTCAATEKGLVARAVSAARVRLELRSVLRSRAITTIGSPPPSPVLPHSPPSIPRFRLRPPHLTPAPSRGLLFPWRRTGPTSSR